MEIEGRRAMDQIPCNFENDGPSSKSSSQLSVCSSGCWRTNANGSRIFSTRPTGADGFPGAGGGALRDIGADIDCCSPRTECWNKLTLALLCSGRVGDGGGPSLQPARPPCFDGRVGAIYHQTVSIARYMEGDLHFKASFHSCTLRTASS